MVIPTVFKLVFKQSCISFKYPIVLLFIVGKGGKCVYCIIVRLRVNRICVDFLLIVLTWGLGSDPSTGAAQMERPVPLYQPQKQRQLLDQIKKYSLSENLLALLCEIHAYV